MFNVDRLRWEPQIVAHCDRFSFDAVVDERRAMFNLELLGPAEGNLQAVSQIIGDMITTDGENTGMLDNAIGVDHILRRATTDVDDQCAELFLIAIQKRQ